MKDLNKEIVRRITVLENQMKLLTVTDWGYYEVKVRLDELKRLLI